MEDPSPRRTAESRSAQVNLELEASIQRLLAARTARQLKDRTAWLSFLARRRTNGSDTAPDGAQS